MLEKMVSRPLLVHLKGMNDTFSEIELRRLDLNLLLVFAALMRERSVTRAAKRLNVGASAVSMALGRLRQHVDDPLFVRSTGRMEPTSRAVMLWEEISPALASIEASIRSIRKFDPAVVRRDVRIAVPDDFDFVLVPRLVGRISELAPNVRIITRPANFRTLPDLLDTADADMAVSAVAAGLEQRHHVRVLHDEGFLSLYDRTMLGRTGDLSIKDWIATPQILRTPSGDLTSSLDRAIEPFGERTVVAGLSTFALVPFLLQETPCLANVPEIAARHLSRAFDLEISRLPFRSPRFDVALHWHVRTHVDPFQVWFRDIVADTVGGLA